MSCSYNFLDLISIIIFGAKYKLCCPEILGSFQSAVSSFNLVSHILTVCSQNKAGMKFYIHRAIMVTEMKWTMVLFLIVV